MPNNDDDDVFLSYVLCFIVFVFILCLFSAIGFFWLPSLYMQTYTEPPVKLHPDSSFYNCFTNNFTHYLFHSQSVFTLVDSDDGVTVF